MRYATIGTAAACLTLAAGLALTGDTAQASLLRAFEKQEKAKSYKIVRSNLKPDGTVDAKSVQTTYISGGKARVDHSGGTYLIHDPVAKTYTIVDPESKRVRTGKMPEPPAGGPRRDEHTFLMEEAKKTVKAGKNIETLPGEAIDGRKVKVYRYTSDKEIGGKRLATTFWLDAKDDTLVRYEADCISHTFRSYQGKDGKMESVPVIGEEKLSTVVIEFSDFGKEFDPKLFDTTPPEGYKVEMANFFSVPIKPVEEPKK